jgi:hypothetical protein
MNSSPFLRLPFDGFVHALKNEGFTIGVDKYIRIQQLIAHCDGTVDPPSLKTILCPLFAIDADEQQRFYELFDRYYSVSSRPKRPTRAYTERPSGKRLLLRVSIICITLSSILAGLLLWSSHHHKQPSKLQDRPPGIVPTQQPDLSPSIVARESDQLQPFKGNLNVIAIPVTIKTFLSSVWFWVFPAFLMLYVAWYWSMRATGAYLIRRERRSPRFSISSDRAARLPILAAPKSVWNLGHMREHMSTSMQLDLARTLRATASQGGFPEFHFVARPRRPEYLVLVDRMCAADHFARLVEHMIRHLCIDKQMLIEYYFFTGDPRVCVSAKTGTALFLTDLLGRRSNDSLLIFGDGAALWNSFTGGWVSWANIILQRPQTAVLTPKIDCWGSRELALARRVVLRTATVDGLS